MVKEIMPVYFSSNSLVKQQLDSYNKFALEGIQEIVDSVAQIKTNVEGFEIKLGKVKLSQPRFYEVRGGYRNIFPSEARIRNITYAAPVFLEMMPIYNNVETNRYADIFVGEIPVMSKSVLCHTNQMSKEELVDIGEDPMDPGGYFIINGSERVLVSLEDLVPNKVMTIKEDKGAVSSKMFSVHHGFRARCVIKRSADGTWMVDFPSSPNGMSLFSLIRAIGVKKDIDVEELFDMEMLSIKNDVLFNIENDPSKGAEEDPELYVAKRFSPGQPKEYQITRLNYLMDNYLLPHLGTQPAMRKRKILYLAKMASRTTLVASGKMSADDRDHYGNKRVKLAGDLMGELFRYAFNYLIKDIVYQASRADVRGRKLQVHTIVRQDALTDRILYSMATGNWVAGQTGVSQLLDRISYLSSLSHRRRVISPLTKKHPHFKARDLHGTHYGKLCPSETPEGPSTSIVKNMAMFCEITTGYSDREVEDIVKKFGIEEE